MNDRHLGIGLAAVALPVVVFAYFWQQRPTHRAAPLTPPASVAGSTATAGVSDQLLAAEASAQIPASPVAAPSLRERLKTDKDHLALALEALPQAQAGDPEAQFVVFSAYRYCHGEGTFITRWDSLEQMREEALTNEAIAAHLESNEALFIRCHGFYTADAARLGDPWNLLQKAVDAGYPPALETAAYERVQQLRDQANLKSGFITIETQTSSMPPIGGGRDPRELLVAAMQSGDPDAFMATGSILHSLRPDLSREQRRIYGDAWQYVGCQKGADCSYLTVIDLGPPTLTSCGPNDGKCTPVPALFMMRENYNWAPVQEVVNQIDAALAAKQWDRLPGLTAGE